MVMVVFASIVAVSAFCSKYTGPSDGFVTIPAKQRRISEKFDPCIVAYGEISSLNKACAKCRIFSNVTSNSIKPWYHCPRDGGRAEIHKKIITQKLIKGRLHFGGGGVLLQSRCLTLQFLPFN